MRRFLSMAIAVVFLSGLGSDLASAAACRDAHGKFTKCPKVAHKHCHDAKGKFTKCSK
jgi:hypothetical protein